jgi:hypothetical protein
MLINDHTCYSQQASIIKKEIPKLLPPELQNFHKILTTNYVYEKKEKFV